MEVVSKQIEGVPKHFLPLCNVTYAVSLQIISYFNSMSTNNWTFCYWYVLSSNLYKCRSLSQTRRSVC